MMKKVLTLLAVATIPATLSGCAACCPTALCPCCPCNWFNRGAPCPPAPAYCPPAPTYAAPLAATACPPTQMMPQYVMPGAAPYGAPYAAAPCNPCQTAVMAQPQPMYYQQAQPAYYAEPSCGCSYMMEPGCGAPFMGMASYGPSMPMDMGACTSGCCEGGAFTAPAPESFVAPGPAAE